MPSKSEKEEVLSGLSSRIFTGMIDDILMDAALQAHQEISRSRAICKVCNTRCNAVHVPGALNGSSQNGPSGSRSQTPPSAEAAKPSGGSSGTRASTPSTGIKTDGTLYLECLNCSRQVASNRYAPHLSGCMGLSGARRGAVRATGKSKPSSEAGRSDSPVSDGGYVSDSKNKGKSKTKRVDDAEFNIKRKRPASPQVSPVKKPKQKSTGSPVSRVKAGGTDSPASRSSLPPLAPSNSHSKIPSKLRESSFLGSSSPSSRSSSPGIQSVVTPVSSSFSAHSPGQASRGSATKSRGRGTSIPMPKRPSPPRPPPVSHYMQVDDGDETGSSTDTDSS